MARGGNSEATLGLPANLEAEQRLLGILLYENAALHRVADIVRVAHFYEPFHQRLFGAIERRVRNGQAADPVLLDSAFASDPAYLDFGGRTYLVNLWDNAPPPATAPDYARTVLEMSKRRRLIQIGRELQDGAFDAAAPVDELLDGAMREFGDLTAGSDGLHLIDADTAMDSVLDYVDNPGNHPEGILTGLEALDDRLGPWLQDDLIVLGGRPGMGKSAIAAIIDQNVARSGGVIEIHAEMSVEQVWRRRLTATAFGIYASRAPAYAAIRRRRVSFDERQMLQVAREQLRGLPLKAVKRTGLTLGRVRSLVLRQKAEWERQGIPLRLVTIDHVGLIKTEKDYSSRVDQQTEISNGLKEMADHLKVPVLALAQLNRKLEERDDKRPTLPDLRDSGSWEQDADVVMLAYRDAYYAAREREPKDTGGKGGAAWADWDQRRRSPWIEAILLKVREGETGTAKLWAHMPTNTILGAAPSDDLGGMI